MRDRGMQCPFLVAITTIYQRCAMCLCSPDWSSSERQGIHASDTIPHPTWVNCVAALSCWRSPIQPVQHSTATWHLVETFIPSKT